jgi:hypothetical protein
METLGGARIQFCSRAEGTPSRTRRYPGATPREPPALTRAIRLRKTRVLFHNAEGTPGALGGSPLGLTSLEAMGTPGARGGSQLPTRPPALRLPSKLGSQLPTRPPALRLPSKLGTDLWWQKSAPRARTEP